MRTDRARMLLVALLAWVLGACLLFSDTPTLTDTGRRAGQGSWCHRDDECDPGQSCYSNSCVPACDDSACPGGYTCRHISKTKTTCRDYCLNNKDCRSGFHCCSDAEWDQDVCGLGECVKD